MKKLSSIIALTAALLMLSCEKKNSEPSIYLDRYDVSFTATETSPQTIGVTAVDVEWDIKVSSTASEWLTAAKDSEGAISISVKNNNSLQERIGSVTVIPASAKLEGKVITVIQEGNPNPVVYEIQLDPSSLEFAPENSVPQTIAVSSNLEGLTWKAEIDEDAGEWLTIDPSNDKIEVSVTDNLGEDIRVGKIIVTPSDPAVAAKYVRVKQGPKKVLDVSDRELHYEAYNWAIGGSITVIAIGVSWTMELTDADGNSVNWVSTDIYRNLIQLTLKSNYSPSPRTAYLHIIPNTDEVEEVVVTIIQDGAEQ